ncbi:MAG: hypothetical protein P8X79_17280 [Reinekea sp.]
MLPENFNKPMGAPAIFEKQIEIKLLHPASTLESRIQVIENRALTTYATEDNTQSWDIYDRDVTEHNLLPVFQKISDDYHQK